ncbi:SpoIIIAH-like family protein [Caldalkalibacillus salinus]|uniref:SpoIIIAH-like family protein n=1 Tax=Caldalkalibacillus salinus TaxID=2803787 RepID=UPI0019221E45|nr:SpoIIIAH-like family protein [Caldalkalibacillus salinus]
MVLKKQTVWLLTMLSLMVVLSAYYLFNHEPTNVNDYVWDDEELMESYGEVESDMDVQSEDEENVSEESMASGIESTSDYFITQRVEIETERQKQLEEYREALSSSEANAQTLAETRSSMERIEELSEAELTIESLLKAEGYEEALVVANDDKVNVVVQADTLDRQQAVGIIRMVQEHLDVGGHQVNVTFR